MTLFVKFVYYISQRIVSYSGSLFDELVVAARL